MEEFFKLCPKCGEKQVYKSKRKLNRALKYNKMCRSCARKSLWQNSNSKYGTSEWKEIQSQKKKKAWRDKNSKFNSKEIKEKQRINRWKQIKLIGGGPTYNPKACEFFDQLNKENGWDLQHALNGGEISVCGYYMDAYDKNKNIIIEYDERHHNRSSIKNKDIIRQEIIIEKLNPFHFFRYNEKQQKLYDVIVRKEG